MGTPARDGAAAVKAGARAPRAIKELWRRPAAGGYSEMVTVDDRVFTLELRDGMDYVVALDAQSGKERWHSRIGATFRGHDGSHDGPISTPAVDGNDLFALDAATGAELWQSRIGKTHADASSGPESTPAAAGDLILAVGSSCHVKAVNARDGSVVWDVDLVERYKTRFAAQGGCGVSPLVHAGVVVLPTGAPESNRLVALALATGEYVWAAEVPRSINTSAAYRESPGGAQVLYHYAKAPGLSGFSGVDIRNGRVLWEADAESGLSNMSVVALPDNRVLLQTWANSTLFEVPANATPSQPRRVWTNSELSASTTPPVYRDGHVYGFGGNSGEFLKCVEVATGVAKWTARPYRGAALLVDRTLVIQSESSGLLRLAAADPVAYRELARLPVLKPGARTRTPPSFAAGHVFLRNEEEIVAVAVR